MSEFEPETLTGELAHVLANLIHGVDADIGENRTYGAGIGPHDEDDQIDALVGEARSRGDFEGSVMTAKSDASEVRYPSGRSADLVLDRSGRREFCEAKLFRFQKANENPSPRGYSKVFSPFQNHSPRSFVYDVAKLAGSEVRADRTFLGIYYRPVIGAGTEITSERIAERFASDVQEWTDHRITTDAVAKFSDLRHDVFERGAIIVWRLDEQPERFW